MNLPTTHGTQTRAFAAVVGQLLPPPSPLTPVDVVNDVLKKAHRSEASSFHVEDVVVACAVFAALLCYHHDQLASPLEEKPVLRVQAVHARPLRKGQVDRE